MSMQEKQVLNNEVMFNLIGDDQPMAKKFKIEFLKQAKESLAEITAHFNQQQFSGINEVAHFLKTSAKAVGAEITAEHLQLLEQFALDQDLSNCKKEILSIHQAVKQVYEVVRHDG